MMTDKSFILIKLRKDTITKRLEKTSLNNRKYMRSLQGEKKAKEYLKGD